MKRFFVVGDTSDGGGTQSRPTDMFMRPFSAWASAPTRSRFLVRSRQRCFQILTAAVVLQSDSGVVSGPSDPRRCTRRERHEIQPHAARACCATKACTLAVLVVMIRGTGLSKVGEASIQGHHSPRNGGFGTRSAVIVFTPLRSRRRTQTSSRFLGAIDSCCRGA